MVTVRDYERDDRAACLALFDGNVPTYFTSDERDDFARFLDERAARWNYQVLEQDARIVACGGVAVEADGATASLCWGMVDRTRHRRGLGDRLTRARLNAVAAIPGVMRVRLDTSQHTRGFYERFGFRVVTVTPDGYAPGLDRVDMVLAF